MSAGREAAKLSGPRKAAILLALLGEDAASTIFRHISDSEVQRITEELSNLKSVPAEVSEQVLEECCKLALTQEYVAEGGLEYATRLLVKAFGEHGADAMLLKLSRASELNAGKVESLQKADPQQLARFLETEHPQTVALVLGNLDSKLASSLLMKLPEEVRAESVRRLANLRQCSPEMAEKVSIILNRRLQSLGTSGRRAYSGFTSVAELMNRLDAEDARNILENIERQEPTLAINIRDLMFTFEDFVEVPEQQLRELAAAIDKKTLTLALKGATEEVKSHFFRTMSSRAIEMLQEDSEALGPVRSRDVSKAQQEIVAIARKLEAEGKIVLKSDGADEYVV